MSTFSWAWMTVPLAASFVNAFPATPDTSNLPAVNWATIGDSYASGVTYGVFGYTNYDDNSSGCMRINHAYGTQLQDDFPTNLKKGNFTFAACSGAHLIDMAGVNPQMNKVPTDTQFVTMQAGGNDAGFYNIARDCIFHVDKKDYGQPYPGPGACTDSINAAERYITTYANGPGNLGFDMDATIRDVLRFPQANSNWFKLYVVGYAHFFNTNSPDSDWCNDQSFSVNVDEITSRKLVKLTAPLRGKINDLTTKLNDKIQEVIRNQNNPKVRYISTTERFDGHRFCEKGGSLYGQYFDSNVWFWNASPALLYQTVPGGLADILTLPANILKQTALTNSWNAAYNTPNPSAQALAAWNWADLMEQNKGPNAQSPAQGASPGSVLRTFHPKADGHAAVKEVIKLEVQNDFAGRNIAGGG